MEQAWPSVFGAGLLSFIIVRFHADMFSQHSHALKIGQSKLCYPI
jgi:hypothetical protein